MALFRLDSHQCGIASGQIAIASSIATNGRTLTPGGATLAVTVSCPLVRWAVAPVYAGTVPPALAFPLVLPWPVSDCRGGGCMVYSRHLSQVRSVPEGGRV